MPRNTVRPGNLFNNNVERSIADTFVDEFHEALVAGVRKGVLDAYALAIELSSGEETAEDLSAADHPFAKRHGYPLQDPRVINMRSGEFIEHWRAKVPTSLSSPIEGYVENDSWKADLFLEGTVNMFARPIEDAVARELENKTKIYVEEEVEKFMVKYG